VLALTHLSPVAGIVEKRSSDVSIEWSDLEMTSSTDPDSDPTACFRRRALALALLTAPAFFVLANAAGAWETRNGGDDNTGKAALALAAAHPGLDRFSMVTAMIGSLLMVPATLGAMRLTRHRAARLGLVGGIFVSTAYISYFAMVSGDRFELAMAARGNNVDDYATVLDRSLNGASVVWYFLLFAVGSLFGTFLLGLALRRSRSIPVWAALAVMAWSVLKIPEFLGLQWAELAGSVVLVVGFGVAGATLWRQTPAAGALASATAAGPQVEEYGQDATAVGVGVEES
jgi:hypothetical protein